MFLTHLCWVKKKIYLKKSKNASFFTTLHSITLYVDLVNQQFLILKNNILFELNAKYI